jgi:hypothetical protein
MTYILKLNRRQAYAIAGRPIVNIEIQKVTGYSTAYKENGTDFWWEVIFKDEGEAMLFKLRWL